MQRPPRRQPRSAATFQPKPLPGATMLADAPRPAASGSHDRQLLIDDFESALREESALNAEDRDSIIRQFRDALDNAPTQLGPPDVEELQRSFAQAVRTMAEEQMIDPAEQDTLLRQLQETVGVLEGDAVRRATEHARRVAQDGPEKAAEWLAAQQAPAASPTPSSSLPAAPLGLGAAARRRRR